MGIQDEQTTMHNTVDLYLGTFLILSGFAISLLNLRRIVNKSEASFSLVLLSENILLTCIGIAFVSRSVHNINMMNFNVMDMEERSSEITTSMKTSSGNCDIWMMMISYGPLTVSLVNSFLSLVIDNYMHYRMLGNMTETDSNSVQEVGSEIALPRRVANKRLSKFWKEYFSFIAIAVQWIAPMLTMLAMYPMGVKEMTLSDDNLRSLTESCMAMMNVKNGTCPGNASATLELRQYIAAANFLDTYEDYLRQTNKSQQVNSVVNNVYNVVASIRNNTQHFDVNVTSPYLFRRPKSIDNCKRMCYLENKTLLLYMFLLSVVSYFVPITISVMILSKIHVMNVKKSNTKTYVSRELLYNILFWTPVMFDTFLSLILCSYTMYGMRTSLLNVVANVYQTVKNLLNTKYFKDNTVVPV